MAGQWLLLIPQYIILAFLWLAFWTVTVIAFFAILFTTWYPNKWHHVDVRTIEPQQKVVATSGPFQRQLPAAQGLQIALPDIAAFEGHERLQPVGELDIVTGVREVALSRIPQDAQVVVIPAANSKGILGGRRSRQPPR